MIKTEESSCLLSSGVLPGKFALEVQAKHELTNAAAGIVRG
jgi:hypothetical protein